MNLNDLIYDEIEEQEALVPRARYNPNLERLNYESKAKTYIQLKIAELEKNLKWLPDTKQNLKLQRSLYALGHRVAREKGEAKLVSILQWCSDRKVHILAAIKVLNNSIK